MSFRLLAPLAIALWAAAPALAADPPKDDAPAIVVRLSSFADIVADIKYVTALEQRKEGFDLEAELRKFTGKDHGGIDIKRPAGLLAIPARNGADLHPLLFIPVADEPLFLAFVERLLGKPQKDKNGVYSTGLSWINFRFDRRYAHVSMGADLLAKERLRDPAKVLATDRRGTLVAVFHLERLPEKFWADVRGAFQFWSHEPTGTPDLQTKLLQQVIRSLDRKLAVMMKQSRELAVQFGIDRKAGELFAEMNLTPKPETQLAKDLAELGQAKSRFAAGRSNMTSALRLLLHWRLPEDLKEAVRPTVDDAIRRVMANAAAETVRNRSVQLIDAIDPTLRAGDLDAGFHLYGPGKDNRYTLVAGLGVKQGAKIEQAIRSLIKALPERDRDKFKFNAARIGRVPVHRADVQHDFGEMLLTTFGSNPVYYVIREDAVWLALGPEAINAFKEVVEAKPRAAPPLDYALAFARLAPLVPGGRDVAEKVFKAGGNDQARFIIEGGKTLRARIDVKAGVITFLAKAQENKGRPFWLYWWW
jgi:hypothetical protein